MDSACQVEQLVALKNWPAMDDDANPHRARGAPEFRGGA